MTWTPVNPKPDNPASQADPSYKSWNDSSRYCLATNRDCDSCDNAKTYGYRWQHKTPERRCWVPCAVQQLLDAEKPLSAPPPPKRERVEFVPDPAMVKRVKQLMQRGEPQDRIRFITGLNQHKTQLYMRLAAQAMGYETAAAYRLKNRTPAQLNNPAHRQKVR